MARPRLRSELLRRGAAADVRWAPHWCRQDEALHDDDACLAASDVVADDDDAGATDDDEGDNDVDD
eukprot:6336066-Pyramimonas_sp.AAC.1